MGCDKCGRPMPLITIIELTAVPMRVFECADCARGIIVEACA